MARSSAVLVEIRLSEWQRRCMPYIVQWPEIALRLVLTISAGGLGLNRSEHGHAAGLRTTLLVYLAASASFSY
jgi:uncharacterized membrane protein YhiD involved in acid resistance